MITPQSEQVYVHLNLCGEYTNERRAWGGQRGSRAWACEWVVTVALLVGAGVLALLLPPAQVVHAATLSVTTCADSGSGSLRNAIGSATAGDTITFATDCPTSGPIKLTGGTLTLSKSVTIDGTGRQVVIDGNCTTDANSNCTGGDSTVFHATVRGNVTLRALTIQHGNGTHGGGIFNVGILTVTDSTLANNAASEGGGIATYVKLTVTGSTLANNFARSGGGIDNSGTLIVTNSTLTNNSANTTGGGIANRFVGGGQTVIVTNSTLVNNSARYLTNEIGRAHV